jgi:hypothetical protein
LLLVLCAGHNEPNVLLLGLLLLVLPAAASRLIISQQVSSCRPSVPCLLTSLLRCVLPMLPATYADMVRLMPLLGYPGLVRCNLSYRAHDMHLPGLTHASTLNSGSVRMRSQAPSPCFLTPERSAFSSAGSQTLYSLQRRVKWQECVCTNACGHTCVTLSQMACT